MEKPCRHPVEEIEDGSQDDEHYSHLIVCLKGKRGGYPAAHQVAAGYGVWNMLFHNLANTVSFPTVRWFMRTSTLVPKGR